MPTARGQEPARGRVHAHAAAAEDEAPAGRLGASRTSIGSGKVAPKPTPAPLIAATIGFRQRNIRSAIRPPLSRGMPLGASSSVPRSAARATTSKPPAGEVVAGAERAAGAGHDDRAHVVVGVDAVPDVDQLALHRRVQRVQHVGPVECDRRDPVVDRRIGSSRTT